MAARLALAVAVITGALRLALPFSPAEAIPREAPLSFVSARLLGGFRVALADVLWTQAQADLDRKAFLGLPARYRLIATLQPESARVWIYNAWNLAYNIPALYAESPEAQWEWIRRGHDFLREGLRANPGDVWILAELGLLFERRIRQHPVLEARARVFLRGRDPLLEARDWFERASAAAKGLPDPADRYHQGSLWLEVAAACEMERAERAMRLGDRAAALSSNRGALSRLRRRLVEFPLDGPGIPEPERVRGTDVVRNRIPELKRRIAALEAAPGKGTR